MSSGGWTRPKHRVAPRIFGISALALLVIALVITAFIRQQPDHGQVVAAVPSAQAPATSKPPARQTERPRAVFIGDSYAANKGNWVNTVAKEQGWMAVNLARGGTGYVATATKNGCGRSYCPNFLEMVPTAVGSHPDVVVVSGGRNDGSEDIRKNARDVFVQLRTALPTARIIAVQPMWDSSGYPKSLTHNSDLVRRSVESVRGEYVQIGDPLKGRSDLISEDGVHPTAKGYLVLASAVNASLKKSTR